MEYSQTYYTILKLVRQLNDDEVKAVLRFVETEITTRENLKQGDLDDAPPLTGEGFFAGPPDLSVRAEDSLTNEEPFMPKPDE
jgi:hypothetical protein